MRLPDDVVILGISKDTIAAQKKFADAQGVTYSLLADEKSDVIKAYGVDGMLGIAKRKTFIVDSKGRVAKVYDDVNPSKHPAEVTAALQGVK